MLSVNLTNLIDDEKCYETVRQMRWTRGVCCPKCQSLVVIKRGKDETQPARQRYKCKTCNTNFGSAKQVMMSKTTTVQVL
jgi:transposase-like protein